jgi:DNA-binding HxlR family transcriptional regulator
VKHSEPDPSYTAFVRQVLDRVGDKWTMLVVRELERDGLVTREVDAEVPPRVEYEVTPLGLTLLPHVVALADWALTNRDAIETHRDEYDARSALNEPAA